jgi:hypothetical protein
MSLADPRSSSVADIVILIAAILFLIFLLIIAFFVVKYREYEFNRIWRTRLLLLCIVFVFEIAFALTILHWFPTRFDTLKKRSVACSISSFLHNCLFLPFFLSTILGFVKALADSSALLSPHPNRGVLSRALLYTAPMAVVGIVNIVIVATGSDLRFFQSYYDEGEQCVVSPFYGVLTTVFTILLFLAFLSQSGLCFKADDLTKPRLNVIHRRRTRRLPLFVIPFILVGIISIIGHYVKDPWPSVIGYISCVICVAVMTIYLYYFIIAPLRESMQVQLLRGNLTLRHGAYLDEALTSSPSISLDLEAIVAP